MLDNIDQLPIKKARKEAGLTQRELSEWLGIPQSTVERWDRGFSLPSEWVSDLVVEKIQREGNDYKAAIKKERP